MELMIANIGWIAVFLGGVLVFLSAYIPAEYETLNYLSLHFGSVLVGAGAVELVIKYLAVKEIARRASEEILRAQNLSVEQFYETRDTLSSWAQILDGASEVWLAWHTGSVQGVAGLPDNLRSIARLILIDPTFRHCSLTREVCEHPGHGNKDRYNAHNT
jgi:hypothetical protein